MWEEIRNLKKTTVGGYNKKSVIDFIKSIATEFTEYKVYSETVIKQLNKRISAMTGETIEIEPELTREFSVQEMMRSRAIIQENFEQINFKLDELIEIYRKGHEEFIQAKENSNLIDKLVFEKEVEENIANEVDSIDAFFQELEKLDSDFESEV